MQVSIQDETGTEVPAGSSGEICVAGPGVFRGYLDNPTANAAAFRDGWFRTGDIGFLDPEGFLYITGRVSDMYISGGSNVHPRDIEEKLLKHPARQRGRRVRRPRPARGARSASPSALPHPASSPKPTRSGSGSASHMARYKVPKALVFWPELPRSGYGKVQRRTVRDLYLHADEESA